MLRWINKKTFLEYQQFLKDQEEDWEFRKRQYAAIPDPDWLAPGIRVRVNQTSGFHRGARGVVVFVEPTGIRAWVLRDGDSSAKYFWRTELDPEKT
jgi:hypothetical protein